MHYSLVAFIGVEDYELDAAQTRVSRPGRKSSQTGLASEVPIAMPSASREQFERRAGVAQHHATQRDAEAAAVAAGRIEVGGDHGA